MSELTVVPNTKTKYRDYYDVIDAVKSGKKVYWRSQHSAVKQTMSRNFNIVTVINPEKIILTKVKTAIKNFGMKDFYSIE